MKGHYRCHATGRLAFARLLPTAKYTGVCGLLARTSPFKAFRLQALHNAFGESPQTQRLVHRRVASNLNRFHKADCSTTPESWPAAIRRSNQPEQQLLLYENESCHIALLSGVRTTVQHAVTALATLRDIAGEMLDTTSDLLCLA